jgi:hypothetical protein
VSPTPPGAAMQVPATARHVRRSMVTVAVTAAAGFVLLIGAGAIWSADRHAGSLRSTGATAPGVVVSTSVAPVGRGRVPEGSATVELVTAAGTRTATVALGGHVTRYQPGQPIALVYDPAHDARVGLAGEAPPPSGVPWVVMLGAGTAVLTAAVIDGRHLATTRRIVRSYPWVVTPARLRQIPVTIGFRERARMVVVLGGQGEPEVTAEPVGVRRLTPVVEPLAWVAGGGARHVLAPPGGGRLWLLRTVA